mmetsp:Transcript_82811/g.192431  ORF Transcript_82811/g.192431 Transcript_82811/m.192431 type:complete len:121 (+) Transcript_82811:422-784(+)
MQPKLKQLLWEATPGAVSTKAVPAHPRAVRAAGEASPPPLWRTHPLCHQQHDREWIDLEGGQMCKVLQVVAPTPGMEAAAVLGSGSLQRVPLVQTLAESMAHPQQRCRWYPVSGICCHCR